MPRTKLCVPAEQNRLAEDIRTRYGNMLNTRGVGLVIGVTDYKSINRWLEGLPCYEINNRKRYTAADVAKRLYEGRTV